MKLIIFGLPGAGKGTQAKLIAEKYLLAHISTGEIFRKNISSGTILGKKVKEIIDKGLLVPDDITLNILENELKSINYDNFLLDGYPRNLSQVKSLEKITKIDKVINIELSDEEAIKRQIGRRQCQKCKRNYNINIPFLKPKNNEFCDDCKTKLAERVDGKPDIVQKRIKVYHEQSKPALDYYKLKGILINIDGSGKIEEIFSKIQKSIED